MMGIYITEVVWWSVRPIWFLIWGGVFERHPRLKLAITESTTVWAPEAMALMDSALLRDALQRQARRLPQPPLDEAERVLPSATSSSAPRACRGARSRCATAIGLGNIMWGSDYPHPEGTWPETRAADARELSRRSRAGARRDARRQRRCASTASTQASSRRSWRASARRRRRSAPRRNRMARVRWVKSLEQVKRDAERNPEFLSSTVRSLRVVYETSPALAAAVIPKPLVAGARPEVCVTLLARRDAHHAGRTRSRSARRSSACARATTASRASGCSRCR